jgi:drug/metabolite transporter (DMT)-like permease
MVPANRIGSNTFTTTQLKVMQEVITLVVFTGFSLLYLKEQMKWNYVVGFAFILLAVFFVFHDFGGGKAAQPAAAAVAQQQETVREADPTM